MAKILKVSDMREFEAQLAQEKITYGRMVELIEEKVLQGCIPKVDLLAQLDKMIEQAKEAAMLYEDKNMPISKQSSGAMAMAYHLVKNWVLNHIFMEDNEIPKTPNYAPKDHISKSDLLAQIETTSQAMKEIAYNEDLELNERHQAYNRFAALQWMKDWVPHLANVANAENGNLGQHENTPNPMQARCLKCKHEWKIELPAIYKETFCPNCGE